MNTVFNKWNILDEARLYNLVESGKRRRGGNRLTEKDWDKIALTLGKTKAAARQKYGEIVQQGFIKATKAKILTAESVRASEEIYRTQNPVKRLFNKLTA